MWCAHRQEPVILYEPVPVLVKPHVRRRPQPPQHYEEEDTVRCLPHRSRRRTSTQETPRVRRRLVPITATQPQAPPPLQDFSQLSLHGPQHHQVALVESNWWPVVPPPLPLLVRKQIIHPFTNLNTKRSSHSTSNGHNTLSYHVTVVFRQETRWP